MGEAPEDIRDEIEETRARMGETVEAIGYKADVKGRVKESVADKKDSVVGKLSSAKDAVVGKADSAVSTVGGAVPDGEQLKTGARKVGVSKQNPLGLAIAGAAVGFVVGTLIPSTRVEDERMGEVSDQVTDKAKEAGQEAIQRGKSVAQEAVQGATETVQERGGSEAQEMVSSLRDKATEATQTS
jgi:gas vesicle protein